MKAQQVVYLDDDYFDIKQIDRKLSIRYMKQNTFFCDVGGGEGNDAFNNVHAGAKGICIEIDNNWLKKGKETAKALMVSDRIAFVKASATNLPFQAKTFDLVTSFSVIDHIRSKMQAYRAISEFSRVTLTYGHVIVTVPNKLFIIGTIMMKVKLMTQKNEFFEQRFTPRELAKCCKRNGLQIIRYDSKYPLNVGKTILTHNVPEAVTRLPLKLLQPLIQIGIKLFSWMEKKEILLLGARYGFDAIKV